MSRELYRSTFIYNGKRYERTSTKSQKEADKKADNLKRDLEDGLVGISKDMRVAAWALEWLETCKRPMVADKCYIQHKRCIEKLINPNIGGLRLNEVTDIHLQKVLNERAGYSFSEVKLLRDTIRAIFRKAKASRLIKFDPAEALTMPNYTKGTHRSIADNERRHFLKVAEAHHAGLMFKTMLYCGLRTGEVVALSWRDIDFDNHVINVVAAM